MGAAALAMGCVLPACSSGGSHSAKSADGPRASGGISRKEYCANGRPVIPHITAVQEQATVVVRWREFFESSDDRVFRVYRRSGPDAAWTRVAEVELPPGNGGSWRDRAPLATGSAEYGVTEVGLTCGEGRLCVGHPPGQQCGVAAVTRRGR